MASFQDLRAVRERLVRLSVATAAREAHITQARLLAIESGVPPTVAELEQLAETYGLDADAFWDQPIVVDDADGIPVLTSLNEFGDLTEVTRASVIRAANAARDLKRLRVLLGNAGRDGLPALTVPAGKPAFEQGADLAAQVRRHFNLGAAAIPSLTGFVAHNLPDVAVLYADLSANGPAGLGFADHARGPAVVLNTRGKNENALVRRFSLAHELCHILVDWKRGQPLASVSGFFTDTVQELEQRANAFAVRLLCPESMVQLLDKYRDVDAVRVLVEDYGVHYRAACLYLANEANVVMPRGEPPQELRPVLMPNPVWHDAERPRGLEDFPILAVAHERRGVLAQAAAQSYSRGLIQRDAFARYLGVPPTEGLEDVLGYFDLDAPDDAVAQGA